MKKLLWAMFIFTALNAGAAEYIRNFDVFAKINEDGSAIITETIAVNAEHNQINRGIFRDMPTKFNIKPLVKADMGVKPVSLKRNGAAEPFFTQRQGETLRINFGGEKHIQRGINVYEFTYTVKNAIVFERESDDFYWNVTGNYWSFPIHSASITVELPRGAEIIKNKISMYSGTSGSKGCPGCTVSTPNNAVAYFKSSAPIYSGGGFTIALPVKKGALAEPAVPVTSILFSNFSLVLVLLTLVLGTPYLLWVWHKVGRDPKKAHVIVAQYEPPPGFSPAQLNYLENMGVTNRDTFLQAIIISLSVKNAIEIQEKPGTFLTKKEFILRKTPQDPDPHAQREELSPEEQIFLDKLFEKANPVFTSPPHAEYFLSAFAEALKNLNSKFKEGYFTFNRKQIAPYWVLALSAVLALFLGAGMPLQLLLILFIFTAVSFIFVPIILMSVVVALFISFFILVTGNNIVPAVAFILIAVQNIIFVRLIKAYTPAARPILDHNEGFKKYLNVAEANRIEESSPQNAASLFCKYLPYAIAFGMANKWAKQFEPVFTKHSTTTSPVLARHGLRTFMNNGSFNYSSFTSSMKGFSSSLSASGGSGGRGGSGGGRGGGGGGGR